MKVITTITKRPDLSREEFQAYYEDHHAPLGIRHFPFEKYVRNHVVAAEPPIGFDCLMECWLDRDKAVASLDGALGAIFAEDEAKLMVTRGIGVDVIEHDLGETPRGVDLRGIAKTGFLLCDSGERKKGDFIAAAMAWAKALVAANGDATIATFDVVLPARDPGGLEADAVVTLWADRSTVTVIPPPQGVRLTAILTLESQETSPEALAESFGR